MHSDDYKCCASFHKRNGMAGKRKRDTFGRKGYVYKQPQPAKSCKPLNVYKEPTVSFEDGTVYNLSYFGTDADTAAQCRGKALRRPDNLSPEGHMSSDTITSASYQPTGKCRPAESCKPLRCYKAPSTPFAKDSVHTLSYMPPGEFVYVEDEEGDSTDQECSCCCECCL